ncbi:hypothetical protein NONO_c65470 [Nocardia nova SH22a]|uniref:Uncharacterized protein n=1 Tax=Nocardia nova SH22a TaxID=1415166 RepID=W5TPX5_9NOCA|nr:hypothetical protein NONO_c65470 [Nocardia nova SH22a]
MLYFTAGTGNSITDLLFALLKSSCSISAGGAAGCSGWGA